MVLEKKKKKKKKPCAFNHYAILPFKAQKEDKHQGIAKDVETGDQEY